MARPGDGGRRRIGLNVGMTDSFAIVLAGGGERLIAWQAGVLAGLAESGLDPRRARTVVGTSAGALVAARLAAGADPLATTTPNRAGAAPDAAATFARLAAVWAEGGSVRDRRRRIGALALRRASGDPERFVASIRRLLPGSSWPASLVVPAVDADTGERVAFTAADGVPVERAVAASRSIPGLRPPVPIDGRRFIDGAIGSATNADFAQAGVRTILAVAGFGANPLPGTREPFWAAALAREVATLEAAGRDVRVLRPGERDLAAMGPDPVSGAGAIGAAAAGRAAGRVLGGFSAAA
jgi:NTE family protein